MEKLDGIEFRIGNEKGALSIVPPSVHPDGPRYEWLLGLSIHNVEPAKLPAAIISRLEQAPKCADGANMNPDGDGINEGDRNNKLFKIARKLARSGVTPASVEAALQAENQARCLPPLEWAEVAAIAKSACTQRSQCPETNDDSVFGFPPEKDSKKPNPKTDSTFSIPVVASALQANAAALSWLWHGFIADKGITLFSALWKAGKTTLLAHLVREMGDLKPKPYPHPVGCLEHLTNMFCTSALCGCEVTPATVLYITEESESRWAKRRDALGISDNVHFICRPFKAKPSIAKWHAFIDHVAKEAERIGARLIVLDTISALWPVYNENDAGEVQAALMPLWKLTERSAVLAVHHLKKGDGQEATGSRGSGALCGFVDTILELRRHDPNNQHSRKRVITGYGRDDETPAELVIELDATTNQYRGLGDRKGMKHEEIKQTLASILPRDRPGMTEKEITEAWPEDEVPTKKALLDALRDSTGCCNWTRDGEGKKGSPYRFFVPSDKTA